MDRRCRPHHNGGLWTRARVHRNPELDTNTRHQGLDSRTKYRAAVERPETLEAILYEPAYRVDGALSQICCLVNYTAGDSSHPRDGRRCSVRSAFAGAFSARLATGRRPSSSTYCLAGTPSRLAHTACSLAAAACRPTSAAACSACAAPCFACATYSLASSTYRLASAAAPDSASASAGGFACTRATNF